MAMHAILKRRPDAIFIQSESTQYFHPEDPGCEDHARRFNEKRFLSLDLTYGHHLNATIYEYLLDNGMTRDEYHWFLQHHVRSRCVMGNDYYVTNENLVHLTEVSRFLARSSAITRSRISTSRAIACP